MDRPPAVAPNESWELTKRIAPTEQPALDRRRGYNEVHDTAHSHWKDFWFD